MKKKKTQWPEIQKRGDQLGPRKKVVFNFKDDDDDSFIIMNLSHLNSQLILSQFSEINKKKIKIPHYFNTVKNERQKKTGV